MNCQHHWVIEPPEPDKATVRGKCKYCPEERDFAAWLLPAELHWTRHQDIFQDLEALRKVGI